MTTAFDCALNGVLLSSLSDCICVLDVQESAPRLHQTALTLYPEGRQQLLSRRESLTVRVVFAIHEEDPIQRAGIMRQIRAWADGGGVLTTPDRPGLQLTVICTDFPAMSSDAWTEACTLTFQTTHCPYWEDAAETAASGSGALTITLPGTAESAPVNALILNTSGAEITRMTLHAGSTRMTFEGIHLPAGRMLTLSQGNGPLTVRANGESILACRTADSDDQLLLPCGRESTIYATADGAVSASFTARGRYV